MTVSILTCNRADALKENLDIISGQTIFSDTEVIVVDNASSDGTASLLKREYPWARHIRLPENIACAGRNAGLEEARSPYVTTLDDDVFLRRGDELERILKFFDAHPEASAVNFKVLGQDTLELLAFNWFHPRRRDLYAGSTFETDYISEGAVAFRKAIFNKTGYYPADFFLSHEGYDLAYRAIDNGFRLFYTGDVQVLHKCAQEQRRSWRNSYYDTRNYVWLLAKHYPMRLFIPHMIYRLATTFMFALLRGQVKWYFRAVSDAVKGLPRQWALRKPLNASSLKRLSDIRRLRPGFLFKMKDFFVRMRIVNETFAQK